MELQLSMFDALREETLLEKSLLGGSGFAGGCVRITAAAETMTKENFVSYLRQEFGIGGRSVPGGFFDHNSTGCTVRLWKQEDVEKVNWNLVAETYLGMIARGTFPDAKSQETLTALREEYGTLPQPVPRCRYPFLAETRKRVAAEKAAGITRQALI